MSRERTPFDGENDSTKIALRDSEDKKWFKYLRGEGRFTYTQRATKERTTTTAPISVPETTLARAPFVWVADAADEDEEAVELALLDADDDDAELLVELLPEASLSRAEVMSAGNWMGAVVLDMSIWPSAVRMSGFMARKARVYLTRRVRNAVRNLWKETKAKLARRT